MPASSSVRSERTYSPATSAGGMSLVTDVLVSSDWSEHTVRSALSLGSQNARRVRGEESGCGRGEIVSRVRGVMVGSQDSAEVAAGDNATLLLQSLDRCGAASDGAVFDAAGLDLGGAVSNVTTGLEEELLSLGELFLKFLTRVGQGHARGNSEEQDLEAHNE